MGKGSPSMIALLGLLAVAGFQNRDKLSGLLNAGAPGDRDRDGDDRGMMRQDRATSAGGFGETGGGLVDELRGMFGGSSGGGMMGGAASGGVLGGLSELLGRFSNPVQSAKARTWVDTGPNAELAPDDLEGVLDDETLTDLAQKTGLDRAELLRRLSSVLPQAVDELTPDGRLPAGA